jgi:hypothetical protein
MYKDGTCLRVRHWENYNMYAEVHVSGLIFEEDKGVVYVSYFIEDVLYRTEKWRLSDLENQETCSDRMIALSCSVYLQTKSWEKTKNYLPIAFRVLNENSWGSSKWMKPLRYFSSSFCMGSPMTDKALDKVLKEIRPEDKTRLSFIMMIDLCNAQGFTYSRSMTPIFRFDYKDLGYECFMYDLCPKKTYGRKKHLRDTMLDLLEEVRLHDSNFSQVKEIYSDFERVIRIKERSERYNSWKQHLLMIDRLSERTSGRFTFSPASIVSVWPILEKRLKETSGLQGTVPILSDLCTAKASFSPVSNRACMAVEAITEISELYSTASTSRLAIKIIYSIIELTMRMFDKNQVGGNREISILSSVFRILQAILEQYGRRLAEASGSDILDRPDKFGILAETMTEAYNSELQAILTADQTRWGPNFSTITFGLMYLLTGRYSTEFYMPCLSCLVSEFKVFELPIWIPEIYKQSTHFYSIPGVLARSHMGQGIFHRSSSFYHSLVLDKFRELILLELVNEGLGKEDVMLKVYCTSDDVIMIAYLSSFRGGKVDDRLRIKLVKIQISRFSSFLKYYGIKTSDYKNILSDDYGEFNSFYFSKDGLGSNDLKFINSLIDPTTSGNFLRDIQGCYNAYDNALNSNCCEETALSVFTMNYIVRLRQWKMKLSRVGFPDIKDIKRGLPAITKQDFDKTDWINFTTLNRFRRKRRLQDLRIETFNDVVKVEIEANMAAISSSSGISNHKNMIVRHKKADKMLISMCPSLQDLGLAGMSYEAMLRGIMLDTSFFHNLTVGIDQPHVLQMQVERSDYVEMFKSLTVKRSVVENIDPLTLAISTLKPCKTILPGFDIDMFVAHVYRRRPRYDDRTVLEVLKSSNNFREAYIQAKSIVDDFSISGGGVRKAVFVKPSQIIDYEQIINVPVGIPFGANQVETITFGIMDTYDYNKRYMSTATEFYGYMRIDLVNVKLANTEMMFRTQNLATGPPMSKLNHQLSQIETDLLIYRDIESWALFEYDYQESFKNTTQFYGKPTVCFLNIYVREKGVKSGEVNVELHDTEYVIAALNDKLRDDIRSYVSTELNMSIEKNEKGPAKHKTAEDDIAELMGLDVDDETRRLIENIFNMTEEEESVGVTDTLKNMELSRKVFEDTEEEDEDDYFGLKTAFADEKSKLSRYSVPIDWRFICLSNHYTIKRMVMSQICQDLIDNNVIKTRSDQVILASINKENILYFDKELPKKVNNLVTRSVSRVISENRCDRKGVLKKIIENRYSDIEISDMCGLGFNLTITGKPRHELIDRSTLVRWLSEGKVMH